jgi:NADPH:quinone reductase-like Zn-dependent oxidoreductase
MHQWILQGNKGSDDLKIVECPIPEASSNDVLIKFHSASLNYRDLMIENVSSMELACSLHNNFSHREPITGRQSLKLLQGEQSSINLLLLEFCQLRLISSDGAGEVVAIGNKFTQFHVGQRVLAAFFQSLIAGTITPQDNMTSLGGLTDGVLCEYGVFNEHGLVLIPDSLSY